jgi:hypothetical protein
MHDGRFDSLAAVVDHYRNPPAQEIEPHELRTMALSDVEAAGLVAFLRTLDGGVAEHERWTRPPRRE